MQTRRCPRNGQDVGRDWSHWVGATREGVAPGPQARQPSPETSLDTPMGSRWAVGTGCAVPPGLGLPLDMGLPSCLAPAATWLAEGPVDGSGMTHHIHPLGPVESTEPASKPSAMDR